MVRSILPAAAFLVALLTKPFALVPAAQGPDKLDALATAALSQIDGTLTVPGLHAAVRVIRDRWGVPHIYASSTEDLYFAQGFVIAQDRLWQMEMWRRSAEGRLAEVLGPGAVPRDRQARLLKYRGAVDDNELATYHPDARKIMSAYVAGVNAYIEDATRRNTLPVEFVLTGIRPERWTVEALILRQNSFGDATSELQLARTVAEVGAQEANRRRNPDPWEALVVPQGLDVSIIGTEVLAATRAGGPVPTPAVLPEYAGLQNLSRDQQPDGSVREPGSNNWVLGGRLTTSGKPVVANDPHREVVLPSLRYIVHLNAPGWNVAGASEPPFLGVQIGHNQHIAWGLTIVGTDQHDVFVEELNPANENEVRFNGKWEPLRVIREEIRVKGAAPEIVELKFSRHGPIFSVDRKNHRAYALKSALHEPGTAPYLAGLRLSQVQDCKSFLDAANYWNAPSENLICGDVDGNISWQASAWTPSRKGWSGRLPVPGTGGYEWQGKRSDLPRELNPSRGFVATANHNIQPKGYAPPLMFKTAPTPFERIARLQQLIQPGKKYELDDHARWQHDAYSLRAAADIPKFRGWTASDPQVEQARADIAAWDAVYARESRPAAIYEAWRGASNTGTRGTTAPAVSSSQAIQAQLKAAVDNLTKSLGADRSQWRWGRMHTRAFPHPFVPAFNLPAVERSGGAGTVAADGASYREIFDVADWDRSLVINTPGQSGQPGSKYYGNLLPDWADNKYFNLAFSNDAVEKVAVHRLELRPAQAPRYEVYAVRFGTIPQFRIAGLVAGADASRRLDIPVMVWLLKGNNGRNVLVDSGFYQAGLIEQWKVKDFRSPADAVAAAGVKAEEITDVILTHAHWDHAGGVDLFPKATVWIQRDEYAYYTGDAWQARNTHGGIQATDMLSLVRLNTDGRVRFVNGDDQEIIPGLRCYTGGRHTHASQYVAVATAGGAAVITSDNVYLYENLEKRVPIAQTLDAASNLKAQDRIRSLASDPALIVPGHDPAVFERYSRVAEGVVKIR